MKYYLKKEPPIELITKAYKSIGLSSLSDVSWVGEQQLNKELMCEVLGEISDLYFPCWYKTYVLKENFSYKDYIVIVRQLLRYKKIKLTSKQVSKTVEKSLYCYITQYAIQNPEPLIVPVREFVVSFVD